jgi:hypothetical protein
VTSERRSQLLWLAVVTAGRALCVVAVGGAALLVGRGSAVGWLWLAAAVLVWLAVVATRTWIERLADRVAYGPEGDPYSRLSNFVRRISETLAVDDVLPRVAQTVTQTTHSASGEVRLWLGDGTVSRVAWPTGSPAATTDLEVALQHRSDHVGVLGVVKDDATPADDTRALLDRLAGPAGLAVANVRLAFELRREIAESRQLAARLDGSRQRLLDAAAEQTRRFSVLVDEKVQSRLRNAARALDRAEAGDWGQLDEAASEARSALKALRDISAGVFPPTLADNGLRVALEAYASGFDGRVLVRQRGGDQRFPGGVEAAAYLCAVQVVDDCAAGLGRVLVDIGHPDASLRVRIRSDRPPSAETVQLVADRVEATDGLLERGPPDDATPHARAELMISWNGSRETPSSTRQPAEHRPSAESRS